MHARERSDNLGHMLERNAATEATRMPMAESKCGWWRTQKRSAMAQASSPSPELNAAMSSPSTKTMCGRMVKAAASVQPKTLRRVDQQAIAWGVFVTKTKGTMQSRPHGHHVGKNLRKASASP